jgi:RNA polymerase subunit RPABC4/transcription elongation factor Spt4
MAGDLWFSQNSRDLSQSYGDDAGFEFEFFCQRCSETWRSGFENYTLGRASGWLRRAGSMASNAMSNVGWDVANTVGGLADAGWHKARDAAFQRAIGKAQAHFHRCARCVHQVCGNCWSIERGLCRDCAPDLQSEIEQARAQGEVAAARTAATAAGERQAAGMDVTTPRQLVCPQCRGETHGAKFCPECGHRLDAPAACRSCARPVPPAAKFCPECGTPA